jgi:PLP dependent protein
LDISESFKQFQDKLKESNPDIQLIAVSKTKPVEDILKLCHLGQTHFGENKLTEGIEKFKIVREKGFNIALHHLGPLQSGTLKRLFPDFQYTHGVGSLSSLKNLYKESLKHKNHNLKYFLQLNLTSEDTKSGFLLNQFLENINELIKYQNESLSLIGLMTMGPTNEDPIETENVFHKLDKLRKDINPRWKLSMGMSGDYQIAIKCNTDYLRIGSLLFGTR